MANKSLDVKILQVTKTTQEWSQVDTIISKGLLCVETTTDGKTKVKVGDGANTFANLSYITAETSSEMIPAATTESLGGVIVGTGLSVVTTAGATKGTVSVDQMTGAVAPSGESGDTGTDGVAGTVPAPTAAQAGSFLRGDGTWATVADENTTYELSGAIGTNDDAGKYVVTLTDSDNQTTTAKVPSFVGATSNAAGVVGLVPAPTSGTVDGFLKSDGSWDTTVITTGDTLTLNCTL